MPLVELKLDIQPRSGRGDDLCASPTHEQIIGKFSYLRHITSILTYELSVALFPEPSLRHDRQNSIEFPSRSTGENQQYQACTYISGVPWEFEKINNLGFGVKLPRGRRRTASPHNWAALHSAELSPSHIFTQEARTSQQDATRN